MNGTSKEYAVALFSLAREKGTEKAFSASLALVDRLLKEEPLYVTFLSSPGIAKKTRLDAIREAFAGSVEEEVESFLCLLCEHGDAALFSDCRDEYERLYAHSISLTRARVTSAFELSDAQKTALKRKLEKISGHAVEADFNVDPALIGGVTVEMDGKILDGSLKHRMQKMKEVMDA